MTRTRLAAAGVLAAALAVPSLALAQDDDPDRAVAGGGTLPAGWEARTDRGTGTDQIKFAATDEGYHVTLGPAAIFYRAADSASGTYRVEATVSQLEAPSHPEAYGVFIGGTDLAGADQRYTYFLVRGDGKFLVKRRTGATTATVGGGWTAHGAVKGADASGKCTNRLAVAVGPDKVSFLVNGTEVYSAPAAELDAAGIAGLRVNHNLDVTVEGFTINRS